MPDTGLPIGPALANASLELGLEGFLEAPSRPVPKLPGGRGAAFSIFPAEGTIRNHMPLFRSRWLCRGPSFRHRRNWGPASVVRGRFGPGKNAVQQKAITIEFYSNRVEFTRRFACGNVNLRFVVTVSYSLHGGMKIKPGDIKCAGGKMRICETPYPGVLR